MSAYRLYRTIGMLAVSATFLASCSQDTASPTAQASQFESGTDLDDASDLRALAGWETLPADSPLAKAADDQLKGVGAIKLWSRSTIENELSVKKFLVGAETRTNNSYPPNAFNKVPIDDDDDPSGPKRRTFNHAYDQDPGVRATAKCVLRKVGGTWILMSSTGKPQNCQ